MWVSQNKLLFIQANQCISNYGCNLIQLLVLVKSDTLMVLLKM